MLTLKLALDSIDPRLWWVAISLVVYLLVFVWKQLSAKLPAWAKFEVVPTKLRALPALLLATAITATGLESAEIGKILLELLMGAASGLLAVGGHETLSRLRGNSGQKQ